MISNFLSAAYPWVLSLHIMSVIAWMAGMFYLPRLYVYHAERAPVGSEMSEIYKEMESKLLRVIINPAMGATWILGLCLVFTPGIVDWSSIWPWVKGAMVIMMSGFHGWLSARRKDFANDKNTKSGKLYRIANEVPTVLMVIIVFMVVLKP